MKDFLIFSNTCENVHWEILKIKLEFFKIFRNLRQKYVVCKKLREFRMRMELNFKKLDYFAKYFVKWVEIDGNF